MEEVKEIISDEEMQRVKDVSTTLNVITKQISKLKRLGIKFVEQPRTPAECRAEAKVRLGKDPEYESIFFQGALFGSNNE